MGKITKFKPRGNYSAFMARQNNAVGKKIGEARKEAKLTQAEFAAKLSEYGVDVKTPAVNKWEHGENIPNAYQLLAMRARSLYHWHRHRRRWGGGHDR